MELLAARREADEATRELETARAEVWYKSGVNQV
jgi:hypothetical protein